MEDEDSSEDCEVLIIKSDHSSSKKRKKHKKRSKSNYDEGNERRKRRKSENKEPKNKDNADIIELFSSVKRKGKRKKDKKKRSKSYSENEQMQIKQEINRYKRTEEIIVDDDDSDIEVTRTSRNLSRSKSVYRATDSDSDSDNYKYNYSDSDIEVENIYVEKISKPEEKYRIPSNRDHSTSSPKKKNHKSDCRKVFDKCRDEDKKRSKSDCKNGERERTRYEKRKRSRDRDTKESVKYDHKRDEKESHRYVNVKEGRNDNIEDYKSHYEKDIREILKHRNKQKSKGEDSNEKTELRHKKDKRDGSRYENSKRSRNEKRDKSRSDAKNDKRERQKHEHDNVRRNDDKKESSKTEHKNHEREKDKKEKFRTNHKISERRRVGYDKNKCDPEKNIKTNRENQPNHKYPSRSDSLTHNNIVKDALRIIGSNSDERLSTKSKSVNEKSSQNKSLISEINNQKERKIGSSKSSSKGTEMNQKLTSNNNIASDNLLMPSLVMKINKNAEIDLITEVRKSQKRKNLLETIKKEDENTNPHTLTLLHNGTETSKQSSKSTENIQRLATKDTVVSTNQLNPSLVMKINKNAEIDLITEVRQPQKGKKDCSVLPIISPEAIKKENEKNNHETITLLHNDMPLPISPFLKKSNPVSKDAPLYNSGHLFRIESVQGNPNLDNQTVPDKNVDPDVLQMSDVQNLDFHLKQENTSDDNICNEPVEYQLPRVPYIKLEEIVNAQSKTLETQKSKLPYIKIEEIITQNEVHSEVYDQVDSKAYVRSVINNEYIENSTQESKFILHKNIGLIDTDTANISIINSQEKLSQVEKSSLMISQGNECLYSNVSNVVNVNSENANKNHCNLYQASLQQYESTANCIQKVTKLNLLPENHTGANEEMNRLASVHPINSANTDVEMASVDSGQPERNTSSIIKLNSFNAVQTENITNVNTECVSDANIENNDFALNQIEKEANINIELNCFESMQADNCISTNSQLNSLNIVQPLVGELHDSETLCSESPMLRIESVWSTATRGATDSEDTDNHYPIPEDLAEVIEDLSDIVEIGRVEVTSTSACSFRIKKENEAARNYYVTHRDIKHCPMCQYELDIDRFKFNPTTMIFTMLCVCNLTIYQLLNPEKYKGCRVR